MELLTNQPPVITFEFYSNHYISPNNRREKERGRGREKKRFRFQRTDGIQVLQESKTKKFLFVKIF